MSSAISPSWSREPQRPLGGVKQGSNDDGAIIIKSPMLFNMLKRLSETERTTIFDISCARQSSIDFFSDYWCKLVVADALNSLYKLEQQAGQESVEYIGALKNAIQFYQRPAPELDMILLWSLPNYLSPSHLKELVKYLMTFTSRRVMLHAYIYNSEKMPAEPVSYTIRTDKTVAMSRPSDINVNCPLYHLAELQKYFSPLKVEHSMILSSGVQEYVFTI